MISGYTINTSVQILIALLRKHGIKKAIISPGTTNLEFVAGMQYSGDFEMYSSVDERSAAYMACGMAAESGEPVIITCTEATASRNYYPGLTEAFYRKLPILVVTGVHRYSQIGHLCPQVIDRSISSKDALKLKVQLPSIKDKEDVWQTEIEVNKAILELKHRSCGPVHIDLPCCNDDYEFDISKLPDTRMIMRFAVGDDLPELPHGRIALFIGSHYKFSEEETAIISGFCASHDAVIFCDHTSGYYGKYAIHAGLVSVQQSDFDIFNDIELLIHMGEPTGDGSTMARLKKAKKIWRVSPDGEIRDTFGKLTDVFEMSEKEFCKAYSRDSEVVHEKYLKECLNCISNVRLDLDKLPFSNIYAAGKIAPKLPRNSYIHLGVSNTIRAWTMFEFPDTVTSGSNVGCRGIDGIMSAFLGAALVNTDKINFCVLGDLTFFYDMNSLGNRSIRNNMRILLVNNNCGGVMKLEGAPGYRFFGDAETDKFIAAAGHFGNKSKTLVKNYAENLGFEYMSAASKEEFDTVYEEFISTEEKDKPIIFEIFTDGADDREAFNIASSIKISTSNKAKKLVKQVLGNKGTTIGTRFLSNRK